MWEVDLFGVEYEGDKGPDGAVYVFDCAVGASRSFEYVSLILMSGILAKPPVQIHSFSLHNATQHKNGNRHQTLKVRDVPSMTGTSSPLIWGAPRRGWVRRVGRAGMRLCRCR